MVFDDLFKSSARPFGLLELLVNIDHRLLVELQKPWRAKELPFAEL
jgi:hypothetical protein